jgi:hypothetical protein
MKPMGNPETGKNKPETQGEKAGERGVNLVKNDDRTRSTYFKCVKMHGIPNK